MNFFKNILTPEELKRTYRKLAILYHPDKGGSLSVMQQINKEYAQVANCIGKTPEKLSDVKVGNIVFVNKSKCVVTVVEENRFKARSLTTGREAYFSKSTGFAMCNFKFKADICSN